MENEETPNTPATPPVTPPATTGDATPVEPSTPVVQEPPAAPPATPPVEPPVTAPEGFVKAEEIEAERTARTAAEARARAVEIRGVARDLGFHDPADAERFIGADEQDIEGALKTVLESKSYLKKVADQPVTPPVTVTNPTNPARKEALTIEAIKQMSTTEIAARFDEVKQVLAQK